jgi:hypothetical protein
MGTHQLLNSIVKSHNQKIDKGAIIEIGATRPLVSRDKMTHEASSEYFFNLSQKLQVPFYSVDLSPSVWEFTRSIVGDDSAVCEDGASFLEKFNNKISILYLDNYDVVYNPRQRESLIDRSGKFYSTLPNDTKGEIQNRNSAEAHFDQIQKAFDKLTPNCIILVDDTVRKKLGWWGKGAKVIPFLLRNGFIIKGRHDSGIMLQRVSFMERLKPKNIIYSLFQWSYTGQSPLWDK